MLENHIYLLQFGVVDDFKEADNIRVSHFLQDSYLTLGFVLWCDSDPAKPTFLGKSRYDLDSYIVTCLKTACQFDLAMNTSSYLVDDLILIDELSASNVVLLNLCLMGPVEKLAVLKVEAYRLTEQTESDMRCRSEMGKWCVAAPNQKASV
jgi:hypothetical protein